MAVTQYDLLDAVTVGASELSILSGTTSLATDTTAGAYQLFVDCNNMAKGDEFRFKVYETVKSGGTKRVVSTWTLLGVQSELMVTPVYMLMNGWDFTIQKIAGTDRAFTASVRKAG